MSDWQEEDEGADDPEGPSAVNGGEVSGWVEEVSCGGDERRWYEVDAGLV